MAEKQKPTGQEDFQKKYVEYNFCKSQVDAFVNEISAINQSTDNLQIAKLTLGNIEKLKPEDAKEIFVPIGGNSFLKAQITDTKNVLVGIGSDVVVKKETPEAIKMLETQLSDLEDSRKKINEQISALVKKMHELEPQLGKMAEELKKSN